MALLSTLSFILSHAFRACVTVLFVCAALIGVGSADHFISSSLRAAALRAHLANPKARPRGRGCWRSLVCFLFVGALAVGGVFLRSAGLVQIAVERFTVIEPARMSSVLTAPADNESVQFSAADGAATPVIDAGAAPAIPISESTRETLLLETVGALLNNSFPSFFAVLSERASTARWELLALITSCAVFLGGLLVQRCYRGRRKSAAVHVARARTPPEPSTPLRAARQEPGTPLRVRQEPSTPLSTITRAKEAELGSAAAATPVPAVAAPPTASTPAPKIDEPVAMTHGAFPLAPLTLDIDSPTGVTLAAMRACAAEARAALRASQTADLLSLIADGVGLGSAQELESTGIPAARLGLSPPSSKSPPPSLQERANN
jgi:hypothetical protein